MAKDWQVFPLGNLVPDFLRNRLRPLGATKLYHYVIMVIRWVLPSHNIGQPRLGSASVWWSLSLACSHWQHWQMLAQTRFPSGEKGGRKSGCWHGVGGIDIVCLFPVLSFSIELLTSPGLLCTNYVVVRSLAVIGTLVPRSNIFRTHSYI